MILDRKKTYLQIALNRQWDEVAKMVALLPASNRIILEAGTPFIKMYGKRGIAALRGWWQMKGGRYVVADLKCMDRGSTEVKMAKEAGAAAATCLGLAPIETINQFILECENNKIDSMVDMLNVEFPFEVLGKLKQLPNIVVIHRGVDEAGNREKEIPFHQIEQIRQTYDVLISVAGGESFKDAGQAIFNDADIAVVWKMFYENPIKMAELANQFLKEIK